MYICIINIFQNSPNINNLLKKFQLVCTWICYIEYYIIKLKNLNI